jgi:predicted nuclease of predicted toxin-antitoxin system
MSKFLANENVPGDVVEAARQAGYDLAWIAESSPGANHETVLAIAVADGRVLLTFDKDFGEIAF